MSVSAIKALRDLIIRICDIRIEYNVKNSNKKNSNIERREYLFPMDASKEPGLF